jgi:hypothetical protein
LFVCEQINTIPRPKPILARQMLYYLRTEKQETINEGGICGLGQPNRPGF